MTPRISVVLVIVVIVVIGGPVMTVHVTRRVKITNAFLYASAIGHGMSPVWGRGN